MSDTYFASREAKETASVLIKRSKSFYKTVNSNNYLEKLNKMWRFYHGDFSTNSTNHEISFTGEQGELVNLPLNHFRNLARHMYNMVTSNRVVMQARAVNTDYRSLSQTFLADGILDYYMRQRNLEECFKTAAETAIVMGAGFVKMSWNSTAGDTTEINPDTGEFEPQGDVEFTNLGPLDVVIDGTRETWDNDWMVVRTWKNKFDLIAKYPEHKDEILAMRTKNEELFLKLEIWSNDETDDVPVLEFFHKKTESMPNGRYMLFLTDNCILLDVDMPYRMIPVFRIAPSNIIGTPYGYTPMFDIYPIQEAINSTVSAIMTNQNAFAVQSLYVPTGANLNANILGEGMNIIEGNAKPEPINLLQTSPETFQFLDALIQNAETISGVNSVARGNPEASLKSGTALALVQSMSLQFMSELQNSYVKLVENTGTALIQMMKDFAASKRVIAIVGKDNRSKLAEFTSDNLDSINRVIVDVGNPMARSLAGRMEMAEQMLQMKLVTSVEQYFMVLETGRIDQLYHAETSQLLLIKSENEMFMEDKTPDAAPTDSHALHIREHSTVLADPELRRHPGLVKIVMDHIQEHMNMLETTDPRLLQLTGQQPIPSLETAMQQMNPQPPAPPEVANAGGSQMGEVLDPNAMANQQGIQGGSLEKIENLPNMPTVPAEALPNADLQQQSMGNVE